MDLNKSVKDYVEWFRPIISDMIQPSYRKDTLIEQVYSNILADNPEIDKTSESRERFRETWVVESYVRLMLNSL